MPLHTTLIPLFLQRRQYLRALAYSIPYAALPTAWSTQQHTTLQSNISPRDQRVPGGIARISLGTAAEKPNVFTAEHIPGLVVGDGAVA